MPGMPVYQDSPANLKNQIYAASGSNVINVQADGTGRLKVSTDSAAPLDVSINEASDSIVVYGNDGTDNQVLKTNTSGQLDIRPLTSADTVSVAISETDDSIVVYGNDGTDNKVLKTNTSGQMDIRPLTAADMVTAVVSQADDSIVIYGNDGTDNKVLKTDVNGVLQVNDTITFTNETLLTGSTTTNVYQYTTQQEISTMSTYMFFVKNAGSTNDALIKVQLSPNGTDWVDDSTEFTVGHDTSAIQTANKFLRYIRIAYKSKVDDASTTLDIIFQGQS